ncbi:hypothetical protein, partial [Undibacterium luofuense]
LNDFSDQRCLALRRPSLDFFFHDHAHVISFPYYHLSRNSLGHCIDLQKFMNEKVYVIAF